MTARDEWSTPPDARPPGEVRVTRRYVAAIDDVPFSDPQAVIACAECLEVVAHPDQPVTAADLDAAPCRCTRKETGRERTDNRRDPGGCG